MAAATPPDAAGERFMLPRDLLGQTATQRSAACEPLRTSGWERWNAAQRKARGSVRKTNQQDQAAPHAP